MCSPRAFLCVLITLAACGDSSDSQGPDGEEPSAGCADGNLTAGNAPYRVCYPQNWNGDLVLYAHGYVPSGEPLAIVDNLVEGTPVSALVNSLGYAFATTSYRANGLVADVAVEDMVALRQAVLDRYRTDPLRTFVVGASEGGLVAALAAERYGDRFAGVVAACGPVGDFARQIDYLGDFRVVFDYFFPGVIPGTAIDVPDEVRSGWDNVYVPAVVAALLANPSAVLELLQVTGAAADLSDINTVGATVVGLLWYDVFGASDAQAALGGQPYDNTQRAYTGSTDDAALNQGVARHAADPAARAALSRFQVSGDLAVPVVTLHTTQDPIVPLFHEPLYADKVEQAGGSSLLRQQEVARYGHCAFQQDELVGAFTTLIDLTAPTLRMAMSGGAPRGEPGTTP